MKKKLLLRGALGFPIGIAIGYVITICISLMWAGGYYSPCVPELAEFCRIDAIQLYNLDSTNMGPEQWQGIAAAVQENYDRYDGFVITHGTDTMGYTAAALSYMIQKSPKPVVLTGSQKSIYNRDTDARNNLWRAVAYACHPDAWGVQIVFDNQVILGTRARKTRTKSFNAFSAPWCWKALAWAACPAGMMVPCLPPCGTGAARGTWLCSPPRYRMRAATLPCTKLAARPKPCPVYWKRTI